MEKNVNLYKAIRVERRKGQRMTVRKHILEGQIKLLQAVELPAARGDAAKAIQLLQSAMSDNEHLEHKLSHVHWKQISQRPNRGTLIQSLQLLKSTTAFFKSAVIGHQGSKLKL